MKRLILADNSGKELRVLRFKKYDFEVGRDENSFEITISRAEYEEIPERARIYIPGTEYGGIFRRLVTNTAQASISPAGYTWRGMMQRKIICPPSGQNYATDSGELNAIVKARVEAAFPDMFVGSTEDTGVTVSGYRYDRYCSLEAGLTKLLKSKGYRLELSYSQSLKAVVVSAVPIVDYSQQIELSSDMRTDYTMQSIKDGVNHLICLGKGELKNRRAFRPDPVRTRPSRIADRRERIQHEDRRREHGDRNRGYRRRQRLSVRHDYDITDNWENSHMRERLPKYRI